MGMAAAVPLMSRSGIGVFRAALFPISNRRRRRGSTSVRTCRAPLPSQSCGRAYRLSRKAFCLPRDSAPTMKRFDKKQPYRRARFARSTVGQTMDTWLSLQSLYPSVGVRDVYLLVSPRVELVTRVRFGRGDFERVLQGQSVGHRRPHLPVQSFEVGDEVVQRGLNRGGPTVARHDDGIGRQERFHLLHRLKGKIMISFEQPRDRGLFREDRVAGEEYLLLRKPNEQIALCLPESEDLELDCTSA